MHLPRWSNPSSEAALSHLTVTYATPSTAGSPAAAASGDAPATSDNPLGFLSALVDTLLGGGKDSTAAVGDPTAATGAVATPPVQSPTLALGGDELLPALGATTEAPAATPSRGEVLLARLSHALDALQRQLDAGNPVTDEQLKSINDTADALLALLAAPSQPLAAPAAEPLGTAARRAGGTDVNATDNAEPGTTPPTGDIVARLLAHLGIAASQPAADPSPPDQAAAAVTSSAAIPNQTLPALADLAGRIADTGRTLAPLDPNTARKLADLAAQLADVAGNPDRLAALAAPGDSDGAGLETIVRQLLAERPTASPPTTPQLAPTAALTVPADLTATGGRASRADQPAPASAAGTSPRETPPAPAAHPAATARADIPVRPRAEIRIAATGDATAAPAPAAAAAADPAAAAAGAQAQAAPVAPAQARAVPAAYQSAQSPINMGQVAFEMVRQIHQGVSRFNIRIDPPELGRVDVRLHVDASGTVNARLTVDRAETLDMFQRDRGALERALGQAGLDAGKTSLEFSLRQNPFAGMAGDQQHQSGGSDAGPRFAARGDGEDGGSQPAITLYRGTASAGGVNIFA